MNRLMTIGLTAMLASSGAAFADDARTGVYPAGNVPIAPYSPGIKTANGFLYVSGQIAYVDGAIPPHASDGENDVQDQTKIVMDNIMSVMAEAGYDFNDAVRATVFITDMGSYGAFNEVYGTYWGEGEMPPARAAVEVGALPGGKPGAPVLVEVSMIAYK